MYKYDEMCIFEQNSYFKLLYEVNDFTKRTRQNVVYAASVKTVLCGASLVADYDTLCYFQPILRVVILGEFYYIPSDWSRAVK